MSEVMIKSTQIRDTIIDVLWSKDKGYMVRTLSNVTVKDGITHGNLVERYYPTEKKAVKAGCQKVVYVKKHSSWKKNTAK
jgi:hypothetical protein